MSEPGRMPNYDVRNDGIGPYAVFYCEYCNREYRSQAEVGATITQDIGRKSLGGLLRKVPVVGDAIAEDVVGEDPRYTHSLTPAQLEKASTNVARCPNCGAAAAGTKFCPECGTTMAQPAADRCPNCGAEIHGAKFCPECGTKIERPPAGVCPSCGAKTGGAKFCPECGTKLE